MIIVSQNMMSRWTSCLSVPTRVAIMMHCVIIIARQNRINMWTYCLSVSTSAVIMMHCIIIIVRQYMINRWTSCLPVPTSAVIMMHCIMIIVRQNVWTSCLSVPTSVVIMMHCIMINSTSKYDKQVNILSFYSHECCDNDCNQVRLQLRSRIQSHVLTYLKISVLFVMFSMQWYEMLWRTSCQIL